MDIFDYNQFVSPTTKYIFIGLLIILLLEVIRFVFKLVDTKHKILIKLKQYFPIIEIFIILSYLIIYLPKSVLINPVLQIVLALSIFSVILIVLWYSIRDIISGLILKSNEIIKPGNKVEINGEIGTIDKLTSRNIKILKENNISVFIPYTKVISAKITSLGDDDKSYFSFEIIVAKSKQFKDIKTEIEKSIIILPWSAVDKSPIVSLVSESDKEYFINIEGYSIDKTYNVNIESEIKNKFQD